MTAGDAAAEDEGEFVGLTDGAIGVEAPLLKCEMRADTPSLKFNI